MRRLDILISGAGIAGCALAYWLARHGHSATVVERGGALRSSGSPVDIRGPAAQVVEQMNIVPRLKAAGTRVAGMTFLDRAGRRSARVDLQALRRSLEPRHIELPRGDLSTILHEASRDNAEFIFGDSIASLAQDDGRGVDVTFERSRPRRFDLVVGADGLHSIVRRLAFGPETSFVRHAGLYVATLPLPREIDSGPDIIMLNAPGKSVTLHPSRDSPLAAFIFWSPEIASFSHLDSGQHKRILDATFAGIDWKVPDILDAARASDELYFDSVSRVEVTKWARGRVALLDWARIQRALGIALHVLGGHRNDPDAIEAAVSALRAALAEKTRLPLPERVHAHYCLGHALNDLGNRDADPVRMDEAVAAFGEALDATTRERLPFDWAVGTGFQGASLARVAELRRDPKAAERAVAQLGLALEVMREHASPQPTAHRPLAESFAQALEKARALRDQLGQG